MSLKMKLFSFFGLLIAGVLAFHWWTMHRAAALTLEQANQAALAAAREIAEVFDRRLGELLDGSELHAGQAVLRSEEVTGSGREVAERKVRVLKKLAQPEDSGEGVTTQAALETRVQLSGQGRREGGTLVVRGEGIEHVVHIPTGGVDQTLASLRARLLGGTVLALVLGLAGAGFIAYGVTRPLGELSRAAQQVARGEFGKQVEKGGGGEVRSAIAAFNEMSSRLQAYDRESKRWQREQHLSELGQIARGFAHTIRNPLNALGLAIEELASLAGRGDPRAAELAASARRQTSRIDSWIRSFLSLATDGEGLEESVDVAALLEDVALECAQNSRAQVRLDLPESGDLTLHGVPAEVRGMVQALAVNAVEASPEGEVLISARRENDAVTLAIEDDGPGIPQEIRDKLFAPHVSSKPQGSGMGLYLAKRVAETRYQGEVELEGRHPRGSRAKLSLKDRSSTR